MRRRQLIGFAFAGAVSLVVPWNGLRPVYVHGAHIAFIVRRHWRPGDVVMADNVEWPKVTTGSVIRCGTCNEQFYRLGPNVVRAAFA